MKKKSESSLTRGEPPASMMGLKGFMLYKLNQYTQENFERFFENLPVHAREFLILRILKAGATTQQQLCESLWIDRATMVGAIQRLAKLGFIKKSPHPEDRRSFLITATEKGHQFHTKHAAGFDLMEKELFPRLNRKENDQFISLLRQIMKDLRET